MQFSELSIYLQKLEETPKRLEITSILSELITKLSVEEIDKAIYLSLGYLKAQFDTERFNMAEKMMIRVLEKVYSSEYESLVSTSPKSKSVPKSESTSSKSPKSVSSEVKSKFRELGDLGTVAYELHTKYKVENNDENIKKEISPEITEVHKDLLKIAEIEGIGSQDIKINTLAAILKKVDKLSAKYIVRIVLGTTRLGFTELTVVEALSNFLQKDKSLKKKIESKYFIHPDIGLISKIIKKEGINGLEKIEMEPGVPVMSQKAQRIGSIQDIVEKLGDCWCEFKFDGTRVQLHFDKNKKFEIESAQRELFLEAKGENFLIKTFTRNLEDSSHQHPDIVQAALDQIDADSVILDGEAIGIDKDTGDFLPFQEIMQRKRKHAVKEMANELPLRYFVFDVLYLDGVPVYKKPLKERHEILLKVIKHKNYKDNDVIKAAQYTLTNTVEGIEDYYNEAKRLNLEGLIVKKPNDPYQAGARSHSWVKLKRADEKLLDDSIDVVVLGYYMGRGVRSDFGIGGFLVGVYDSQNEVFKTITKVGTGLSDKDWKYLKKEADKHRVSNMPKNVVIPKEYTPDVITAPELVVEIGGDEISVSKNHSAGYAVRFPRLLFFRTDKKATQATTTDEIITLYKTQKRGQYGQQ